VFLSTCFDTGHEGDGSEARLSFENGKAEFVDYFFFFLFGHLV
jgi:hypothetical protein